MSNSNFIGQVKKKIIKEFIKDNEIVQAIHATEITSAEKLVGTHIFNYHENPNTINKVMTFITVQVHIPSNPRWNDLTYVQPRIEIWIIRILRNRILLEIWIIIFFGNIILRI